MSTATSTPMASRITICPEALLAGQAIFTASSASGQRYTYRVSKSSDPDRPIVWFVSLLTGRDNEDDDSYTYLGLYHPQSGLRTTAKSAYAQDAVPCRVFAFAARVINGRQNLPDGYAILNEGTCARCGRRLTTPESLASGLGPICRAFGRPQSA